VRDDQLAHEHRTLVGDRIAAGKRNQVDSVIPWRVAEGRKPTAQAKMRSPGDDLLLAGAKLALIGIPENHAVLLAARESAFQLDPNRIVLEVPVGVVFRHPRLGVGQVLEAHRMARDVTRHLIGIEDVLEPSIAARLRMDLCSASSHADGGRRCRTR
jgi:hypothetical protein